MARSLTAVFRAAAYAVNTTEVPILLLTIEHASLAAPVRLTTDATETVSRGETFVRLPFDLVLPDDVEDRPPRARLTVDNVDREMVRLVRTLPSTPTITMELILGSDPDTVEETWGPFESGSVDWDVATITTELAINDRSHERYPEGVFSPTDAPALFKTI